MLPIHSFMPTSNLIVERPQIILELASKDVEKVVFQEMKKGFQCGKVDKLVFIFSVTSKVRIYENLKNVFQEALGGRFSQTKHHEKPDMVKNRLQRSLNLSSKNVKNAFFEYMTRYRSENGTNFVAFTFTLLSTGPAISRPLYSLVPQLITTDPVYAELEENSSKESEEPKENNPPPIPWATHPSRKAISNPLYDLAPQLTTPKTKRRSLLERAMKPFKRCLVRKSLPTPQARYTLHAFDSGFECDTKNSKKRNLSEDSGYEIPRQVEPVIYLEVLS